MGHLAAAGVKALTRKTPADLVIGEKFGRLANRIWLFAHVIAHARDSGSRAWNPCFDEYSEYFTNTRNRLVPSYPLSRTSLPGNPSSRAIAYSAFARGVSAFTTRSRESRFHSIVLTDVNETYDLASPEFAELECRKKVIVRGGWRFRDYAAFDRHEDAIRDFFRPADEIATAVNRITTKARENADVLVGLHMRAGDYRTFLGGKYYYPPLSYRAFVDRAVALFPGRRVRFLICSEESLDPEIFRDVDSTPGSGNPAEDLIALSQCDFIVGPPSTYTLWSSFYGKVPLLVVRDSSQKFEREDFRIADGRFDVGAEVV